MNHKEEWFVRELKPGDHIRVKHGSFYHHGIYEGNGMVIHFAGPSMEHLMDPAQVTVRRDTLEAFGMGRYIEVRKYSAMEKLTKHSVRKSLKLAVADLGKGGYDILHNNCEHFVNRCVFGKSFSSQIDHYRAIVDAEI